MNLGYCCINTILKNKKPRIMTNRGMIKKTFLEKGVKYCAELALCNVSDLKTIIEWNIENNISLYRMSSKIFPWMSEYELDEILEIAPIYQEMSEISQLVHKNGLRLTFHPDHFNVLASTNFNVVQKTIKELNQHAEIMDLLGLPRNHDAAINVHVNTTQGGKDASLKRFVENFEYLSDSCKKRLVVENDDKESQYTTQELCEVLYPQIGTPITFDYHHHRLNPGIQTEEEALKLASNTWGANKQLTHYSSSRTLYEDSSARSQAHADYVYEEIRDYDLDIDVELEVKAKEKALLQYRKDYMLGK